MKRTNDSLKPFDWHEEWLALDEAIENILARYHPNHPDTREDILGEMRSFLKKVEDVWSRYFLDAGVAEARQATSNMLGVALAMAALASTEKKKEKQNDA